MTIYRRLNEKMLGDAYPLPNICDILDQLGGAKYFSVLDLASGFHQIPMDPEDTKQRSQHHTATINFLEYLSVSEMHLPRSSD
ncbi:reverse transcriptase [Lasius niger]|uniref:Reverse transcriptase n=1 Tax=Lasius niger TaxID=67767 RepID=A0A0J7KI97_LASNI|nr:reverse transcriptase [Lasius niger]